MKFDYTDQEYRTECLNGCGLLTVWMQSRMVAIQAGNNHENSQHHSWNVEQRMKQDDNDLLNREGKRISS